MRYEEFVKYAERLLELGVRGFILTGGGEPTLCRDFKKITDWLEAHSIHYGINTNFNEVQYIKPDYLKVSLDGWDEDSYEKSRGVRAYEKVRNNIQAYADWKRRESPETTLGIQRVVEWPNDVWEFYTANCDLDVDYIVFRPIESTGGIAYLDEYSGGHIKEIIYTVEELAKKDSRVKLNFKWNLIGEQESTCTAQWAQIAVNEHGHVMYCCHKPYEINTKAAAFLRDTVGENPAHELRERELELKIAEFEYKKERDAGISQEIEDLDEIEEEIYGKGQESKEDQEVRSEAEENDTV